MRRWSHLLSYRLTLIAAFATAGCVTGESDEFTADAGPAGGSGGQASPGGATGGQGNPGGGNGGSANPGGAGGQANPGGSGGQPNPGGSGGQPNPGGTGGQPNPGGELTPADARTSGGDTPPPADAGPTGGVPVPDLGLPPPCEVPAPLGCPATCADATGACPVDIYTFRTGVLPGVPARVRGVVTSVRYEPLNPALASHLSIQVPTDAPEYTGPVDSGLWIFLSDAPNPLPMADFAVGDLLELRGESLDYFGQHQLHNVNEVQRLGRDHDLPAFTSARPVDLATGGAFAAGLEGALVEVDGVTVTDLAPPRGEGDEARTGEFAVDAGLRVDDFVYTMPFPALGAEYDRIAGVLRLGNANTKIEPRGFADFTQSLPTLLSLLPANTELDVGVEDSPRAPNGTPLTVTLDRAAPPGGVIITLASGDPNRLRVPPTLLVPAGSRQAEVVAEGVAASADTRLTASFGGRALDAHVAVVQRINVPHNLNLTVEPPRVQASALVRLHVEMDEAPPGGFQYVISTAPAGALVGPSIGSLGEGVTVRNLDFTVAPLTPPGRVTVTIAQVGRPDFTQQAVFEVVPFVDYTGLVINEVDYDNPDLDTFEFVELYNGSPNALPLGSLRVELINGADLMRYTQINLIDAAPFLPAGEFLAIGSQPVLDTLPPRTLQILLQGSMQNGPDAVRIVDVSNPGAFPIDAVASEGLVDGSGEGNPTFGDGNGDLDSSLSRCPDGADQQDNLTDFTVRTPSPGVGNVCF